MLLFGLVATCALDQSVVRDRLRPGDLAVTGATLLGRTRSFGRVRIVAADTGLQRIVGHRIDLRKTGRPRGVMAMTQGAITTLLGDGRTNLHRILNVGSSRPMAHLARHIAVPPGVVHAGDIVMVFRGADAELVRAGLGERPADSLIAFLRKAQEKAECPSST